MKQCNLCLETKDLSEFQAIRPKKSGGFTYSSKCRKCLYQKARDYLAANPDRKAEILRYGAENQKRRAKEKLKTLPCEECGKEFTQSEPREKYCSIACSRRKTKRNYRRRVSVKKKAAKVIEVKNCLLCGKEFTHKDMRKKFCSTYCLNRKSQVIYRLSDKNKDTLRASNREWRKNNLEKIFLYKEQNREHTRAYKEANREKIALGNKRWRAENPELVRDYKRRRKVLKRQAPGSHTLEQWNELKAQQDYTCLCCGKREPEITLTRDHIHPLIKGGSDDIANIQGLCRNCNSKKATSEIDYRAESSR